MARRGMLGAVAIGLVALAAPGVAPARAAEIDVKVGESIARRECARCHIVGAVPVKAIPPSFYELAQDPATTEMSLRFLLSRPHDAMPNLRLGSDETAEIVAYILSLRQQAR